MTTYTIVGKDQGYGDDRLSDHGNSRLNDHDNIQLESRGDQPRAVCNPTDTECMAAMEVLQSALGGHAMVGAAGTVGMELVRKALRAAWTAGARETAAQAGLANTQCLPEHEHEHEDNTAGSGTILESADCGLGGMTYTRDC